MSSRDQLNPELVRQLWEDGKTDAEMAEWLSRDASRIAAVRNKMGLRSRNKPRVDVVELEQMLELRRQGFNQKQIAAELGRCDLTIRRILKRYDSGTTPLSDRLPSKARLVCVRHEEPASGECRRVEESTHHPLQ